MEVGVEVRVEVGWRWGWRWGRRAGWSLQHTPGNRMKLIQ